MTIGIPIISKFRFTQFSILFAELVAITMFSPTVMAEKIEICHKASNNGKQKTIKVRDKSLKAHEGHGDFAGRCDQVLNSERLMVKCDVEATTFVVAAASGSENLSAVIEPTSLLTEDCAVVQVLINAAACKIFDVIGTPDSQVYTYACPNDSVAIENLL
jgi:hypothetical protein